jgi:hypothetical protein
MRKLEHWLNVGVHPTPDGITRQFALATVGFWNSIPSVENMSGLRMADLFCGDGRLGRAVCELFEVAGNQVSATFVEVDRTRFGPILSKYPNVVQANAFVWEPDGRFDLIVCNPPYQMLAMEESRRLGISWETAKQGGKNLYCLSILRALALCRPGGLVGVIAPFGWLRGVNASEFREAVAGLCSRVIVIASRERDRFGGPHQDTALQFFYRRSDTSIAPATCTFSYEHSGVPAEIDLLAPTKPVAREHTWRVRVGPLVWNRHVSALTAQQDDTFLLVYGGNIREGSPLDLSVSRYRNKQYVKRAAVPAGFLTRGPAILFRRTLRGRPGEWSVDSVEIDEDFACVVAENHVICVELPGFRSALHNIRDELVRDVQEHYRLSGSPNISAQAMRQIVSRRLGKPTCMAATA